MEHTITHNVNDIPADDKRALEGLLGAPLDADQHIFILAYTPRAVPDGETRNRARERLERITRANQALAQAEGTTAAEADDAVAEAMHQIRRRN